MLKIIECIEKHGLLDERIDHITLDEYMTYLDYLHDQYDKGTIYYLAIRKRNIVNIYIREEK